MDSIQEYINQFHPQIQEQLNCIRNIIIQSAPNATEKLSWGVPTYMQNGFLVQFAGYKNHIGFYCSPTTIKHFHKELESYKTNSKNTIHFLYSQELPIQLIKDIVRYRISENQKDTED